MKRLIALFVLSLGLGLGGLYLATRESVLSPSTYSPADPSMELLLLALLCFAVLWLVPVIKIRLLGRAQGEQIGNGAAFAAHVGQVFGAAMTPSGTGGGPAFVLALERGGVKVGTAVGMALQLFILDLAALGVLIPIGLVYILLVSPLELPRTTSWLAAVTAVVALVLAVLLSRFPGSLYRLLLGVAKWRLLRRFEQRLVRIAREFYVSAVAFRDMPLATSMLLHLTNLGAWLANFAFLWALLSIYGAEARLLDVLAVLAIITLIGFFFPTPGASGFTELMVGLAVDGSARSGAIAAPVALWRAGTFYIVYLIGPLLAWLILARRPPAWLRRRRRDGDPGVSGETEG